MLRQTIVLGLLASILLGTSAGLYADDGDESVRESGNREEAVSSPLGVRQQRVKRMMQTLDRKFQDLAAKLRKTEPEQAELLIKAYQQSQERLIEERMTEISELLNDTKLGEADTKQDEVMLELDALLRILLDQSKDWDKVNEEARMLEEMRKAVQDLLKEQRDQLEKTDRLANKDRTLEEMDEQIRDMEDLIEQQSQLEKETAAAKDEKPEELDGLAEKQQELQQKTDELAAKLGGSAEPSKASETPKQAEPPKENEDQPKDSQPKDAQPKDAQPKDAQSKDAQSKDAQSKDAQSKDAQSPSNKQSSNSGKSGDGKPSDGSGECKACLGKASSSQKSAAIKLKQQLPKDALKDEQKAIEDLEKALAALKEERDRIARLPKKMLDQMAERQENTTEEAQKVLEQMASSQSSESKSPPKGMKNLQQAQDSMKQAADGLRQVDADAAAKDQEKAVEELKKALDEIEQRLAQLREDTLIDRLSRLEARFRAMLALQKEITAATLTIAENENENGKLSRSERLKLRKLSSQERELAEKAFQTLDILVEDGTSVVFPRVVKNVQEDLELVANQLADQRTDAYTQSLQQGVEVTLQELIDALQRNLKKKKGGGGGSCDCEPPLLPGSAELKLLRSMQVRVNRRTEAFDKLKEADKLDDRLEKEVANITALQEEVAEMTLELAEKY
ncbi:MAG: hypothetical protein AAGG48_24530 [Planctomycetota bacterium]